MRLSLVLSACLTCLITSALPADAPATLPGTNPLTLEGDIASHMIDGIDRFLLRKLDESVDKREQYWRRDFSSPEAYAKSIEPNRKRLAHMLGVRDERIAFDSPDLGGFGGEYFWALETSKNFLATELSWPVIGDIRGDGLILIPTGTSQTYVADVIAIPDSSQTPEDLVAHRVGIPPERQFVRRLAESGCRVYAPALIGRAEAFPKLPHREYLNRSAFELGRHLIGYEIQKILALVDVIKGHRDSSKLRSDKIGIIGYGDGGMLALYAAAIDPRIDVVSVMGYFEPRESMWTHPIDRNIFGLLERFGDAEIAAMIAPRPLVLEAMQYPKITLAGGRGAPATLSQPNKQAVSAEVRRVRDLTRGLKSKNWLVAEVDASEDQHFAHDATLNSFLKQFHPDVRLAKTGRAPKEKGDPPDRVDRHTRRAHEIDRHNQALLVESQVVRNRFMKKLYDAVPKGLDEYQRVAGEYRRVFRDEVIGRFEDKMLPFNARTRLHAESGKWTRYEVMLDVFPDVFAYGLLVVPKGIKPNERRPVVVCQHGLEGRPIHVVESDHRAYHDFATKLAERGFVVFAPQNIYIFKDRFRTLQRKANPLGKTLFSIMVPQHQQITDWLKTQPFVDGSRIAFYGLSYGGKSAMRIPPLVSNYCLSICSADFNEWVWKNASTSTFAQRYTYANKGEYEIFEWDLGSTFNYAEMAALIAPRPFMVERGHDDGVAPDEMVAYEYAKVRRLYTKLGIADRTEIEFFDGPHTIHGVGTFTFLHKHLDWPEPTRKQ